MDFFTAYLLTGVITIGCAIVIAWRQNCILEKKYEQYLIEKREAEKHAQQQS